MCHNQRKPYFLPYNTSLKCNDDELILMLGFQIRITMDLDLFDQIQILQEAKGSKGAIFHVHIPIGIRVVANTPDLRSIEALLNRL
jgi:hypothetical protein